MSCISPLRSVILSTTIPAIFVDIDDDLLDRLEPLAGLGIRLEEDARARDRQLEALAAHRFDQHAQAATRRARRPRSRPCSVAFAHLDRDVALGFALQPLDDHARGDLAAFAPGERAVVDREGHRQGRRIDRVGGKRRLDLGRADRVGDGGLGEAGDGDDVAGLGLLDRPPLQPAERQELGQPRLSRSPCRRATGT